MSGEWISIMSGEWISIYESLPPYGVSVWTWDGKKMLVSTWWPTDRPFEPNGVTHWMPLPEPPKNLRPVWYVCPR